MNNNELRKYLESFNWVDCDKNGNISEAKISTEEWNKFYLKFSSPYNFKLGKSSDCGDFSLEFKWISDQDEYSSSNVSIVRNNLNKIIKF